MQTNYEEMMRQRQQEESDRYQKTRDPFQYGQQVAQRRYSEIMSNLDTQRQNTQQSYGDLYSQARQRAVRSQAAGGPTLSGGMGQQQRDYVSALEMQELSRIGASREGAMRDLQTQAQSAFANAELEGQQATQLQLQNQTAQLGLIQQRQAIINSDLDDEQKAEQLAVLGVNEEDAKQIPKTDFEQAMEAGIITGGVLTTGAIASAIVGKGAILAGALTIGSTVLLPAIGILAVSALAGFIISKVI